jgi:hypothetical protein
MFPRTHIVDNQVQKGRT